MAEQKKWTSLAGPIQTKRVNKAIKDLGWHAKTTKRITDHGEFSSVPLFSPINNPVYDQVYAELGEQFGWTITRENYQDVIKAFEQAKDKVPVTTVDERTTPEQRAQREKERQEREEKQAVEAAARKVEVDRLVAELRAKYPHAKSGECGLSPHARAAANIRMELAAKFPGIKFSVKSKSYSGGDSIDVRWEMGPTAKEVKEITEKYEEGSFNGMIDMYESDRSAYRSAVESVLGGIKYSFEDRDIPLSAVLQVRDLVIDDMQLPDSFKSGGYEWYHAIIPGSNNISLAQVVRSAFANVSFPPGAKITGIVPNENGNGMERYLVTFEASVPAPVATTEGGSSLGVTTHIEKHRHTKKGFDMFLVVLDTRVEADTFSNIRDRCKAAGGWYSRKWGRTPGGFAFEQEEKAVEFAQTL